MDNRNLKFRVWNKYLEIYIDLEDLQDDLKYKVRYKPEFSITYIPFRKTNKPCDCVVEKSIGYKDKNGYEIFEGDILKRHFHNNGPDEISYKFIWKNEKLMQGENFKDDEIIGNWRECDKGLLTLCGFRFEGDSDIDFSCLFNSDLIQK